MSRILKKQKTINELKLGQGNSFGNINFKQPLRIRNKSEFYNLFTKDSQTPSSKGQTPQNFNKGLISFNSNIKPSQYYECHTTRHRKKTQEAEEEENQSQQQFQNRQKNYTTILSPIRRKNFSQRENYKTIIATSPKKQLDNIFKNKTILQNQNNSLNSSSPKRPFIDNLQIYTQQQETKQLEIEEEEQLEEIDMEIRLKQQQSILQQSQLLQKKQEQEKRIQEIKEKGEKYKKKQFIPFREKKRTQILIQEKEQEKEKKKMKKQKQSQKFNEQQLQHHIQSQFDETIRNSSYSLKSFQNSPAHFLHSHQDSSLSFQKFSMTPKVSSLNQKFSQQISSSQQQQTQQQQSSLMQQSHQLSKLQNQESEPSILQKSSTQNQLSQYLSLRKIKEQNSQQNIQQKPDPLEPYQTSNIIKKLVKKPNFAFIVKSDSKIIKNDLDEYERQTNYFRQRQYNINNYRPCTTGLDYYPKKVKPHMNYTGKFHQGTYIPCQKKSQTLADLQDVDPYEHQNIYQLDIQGIELTSLQIIDQQNVKDRKVQGRKMKSPRGERKKSLKQVYMVQDTSFKDIQFKH